MITRKRIEELLDSKSFAEINGDNKCGIICGYGTISGRPVCIYSQDSSEMNGILTKENLQKINKVFDIAIKTGVPLISIWENSQIKLDEGVGILKELNNLLKRHVEFSGVIPQISLVCGECVGTLATLVYLNDFVFTIDNEAKISSSVLTEDLSNENKSAHFMLDSEEMALNKIKDLVTYIPDNNLTDPDVFEPDDLNKLTLSIYGILNNDQYDVKDIIREISDNNSFFEIAEENSNNIVTGFIRLGGRSIGIVANCINNKKMLDINAFNKAARFVRFCDAFNMPIITLIDTYGIIDDNMIMKHGAKLFYAYAEATVPKINVILKNAFGGAYLLMGGLNADISYALNSAKISTLNPTSMAVILNSEKIANNVDKDDIIEEYKANETLPISALKQDVIDDIIFPENIRQKLISAIYLLASKRENKPVKKHGNIPL